MIAQQQKKCRKKDRHRVMAGCHSLGATVSSAISRSSLPTCWRNSLAIPGRRTRSLRRACPHCQPTPTTVSLPCAVPREPLQAPRPASVIYRGDYGISEKQTVVTEPFYRRSEKWMMVFCISRKYPTRMARYALDTLEFYRRTVLDGLNMDCLVPTIPMGRSRPKGCMLMVKNTGFGQRIIQMGNWPREGTTRTAKRWAIGSFG